MILENPSEPGFPVNEGAAAAERLFRDRTNQMVEPREMVSNLGGCFA